MSLRKTCGVGVLAGLLAVALPAAGAPEKATTVKGYVVDSACAFIKNLTKPVSPDCAVACAKAGSPLVILAEDGTIYWPISETMPAKSQNDSLIKFAGKKVVVAGKGFVRGGSHALVIEKIEAAPAAK